ncbi:MAG TPA: hypothetical protein VFG87_17420, partial [Amycolatopsis sp.]|nr:hypothetical protein [Amycolatopsis sp.]
MLVVAEQEREPVRVLVRRCDVVASGADNLSQRGVETFAVGGEPVAQPVLQSKVVCETLLSDGRDAVQPCDGLGERQEVSVVPPGDPALVERDGELASLVEALAFPPAVAVVEGEPGIGKTFLVR